MTSEAATATPQARGVYARIITLGVVIGYGLVLMVGSVFWHTAVMKALLSGPVLLLSSLVAAAACGVAWRRLSRPTNVIWLILAIAGVFATLSQASELLPEAQQRVTGIHSFWLVSYLALFFAVVIALQYTERGRLTELALDLALVLTAAALVIVRWAPGARVALSSNSMVTAFLIVFGPSIALATVLVVSVLVTSPRASITQSALSGLAAAVGFLLISAMPQLINGGACCHTGSATIFAAIGMWGAVAYSAANAWRSGDLPVSAPGGERLRQVVAPTVAIVLAAISVEAALNPPLGRRTAITLGVLGALVALRLTELLNATRTQVAERRELAQTRALVEVSRALAGKNDLDTTLRLVTQWAVRVLNARAAAVELLSSDGRTLVLRAAEGMPDEAVGLTFQVDNSFTGWVIVNGEPRVTANASRDPFISPDSLRLLGDAAVAAMPLRYRERMLGVLSCVGSRPFDGPDLDLLRAFANQTALALEDARLFEQVRALSVTDPLTGLANRRQLDRELTREFAAAQRGRKLVAVMFDLDDFKQHNDRYGHLAGDEALRHFAEALQSTTRTMNLAARYGGDEFFALLADADFHGAEIFISRVKERFRRTMDASGWPPLQVSAGMAEYTPDMQSPEDLIVAADRALYAVKFESDVRP